jgi:hypothetical protein
VDDPTMKRIACRIWRSGVARGAPARAVRRMLAVAAIGALGATAPTAASACGYHVAIGGVSVVHPSSIAVAVAIHAAVSDGRLSALADAPAPLALVRANGAMRNFALTLGPDTVDLPPVAFVLVEAHLWGRVVPGADGRLRWDAAIASGLVVVAGPAEGRARVAGVLARQFS